MGKQQYYIYILTNKSFTLYTGVTNNLERRVWEHKEHMVQGFTTRYNIDKLVYYEIGEDAYQAITREKQIKGWTRKKKIDLIKTLNPTFKDLGKIL